MDETLVFRKTGAGAAQLASTHGDLSPPARRLLILLDGRRSLGELAELFGADTVEREIDHLQARAFVRQVDPDRPPDPPTIVMAAPDTVVAADEAAVVRRMPSIGLAAFAVVAAVCASAYWLGGSGTHATAPVAPAVAAPAPPSAPVEPPAPSDAAPAPVRTATALALELPDLDNVQVTRAPPAARRKPGPPAPTRAADAGAAVKEPRVAAAAAPRPSPAVQIPDAVPAPAPAPAPSAASAPAPGSGPGPSPASGPPTASAVPVSLPTQAAPATPALAAGSGASEPPVQVAALQPPPASSAAAPVQLHPRKHEAPQFPARALREGITDGRVEAMIRVSSEGKVDQVEILRSVPSRVFDDEVRRALSQWTFDPPGRPVQKRIELDFKP